MPAFVVEDYEAMGFSNEQAENVTIIRNESDEMRLMNLGRCGKKL
jgi:hypothetical protein